MRRHDDIHRPLEHSGDGIGRGRQLVAELAEQTDDGTRVRIGRQSSALTGWDKKVIDNIIGCGQDAAAAGAAANSKRR